MTFKPNPLFKDNGSGMHVHQSLWKNGEPLFYDEKGYGALSEMAIYYIGGLQKHAPSLLAFYAPTTHSYRRLVPGYEAPINLVYSARDLIETSTTREPWSSSRLLCARTPTSSCCTTISRSSYVIDVHANTCDSN